MDFDLDSNGKRKWLFSVVSSTWHGFCTLSDMVADCPVTGSGRQTMTYYISLSQLAASLVAAIAVSTLFISAAVGPAAQFI